MGQNSIRTNLTKEDIIADIRLTLSVDFERKTSVIIVEGEDDLQFFNGKLHPDVEIRESFSGKTGVNEIVDFFSDDRVFGICDTDYEPRSTSPQMFYYDYSCLEMMLISDDAAFVPFCCAYYQGTTPPLSVREMVLVNLKWLSFFRKLNAEQHWGINFRGVSISKAFSPSSSTIEFSRILSQINETNSGLIANHREYIIMLSTACSTECDYQTYLQITQGHDFIFCFQAFCESVRRVKGKAPSPIELFRALICSYRIADFRRSSLYTSLQQYESTYNRHILIA